MNRPAVNVHRSHGIKPWNEVRLVSIPRDGVRIWFFVLMLILVVVVLQWRYLSELFTKGPPTSAGNRLSTTEQWTLLHRMS